MLAGVDETFYFADGATDYEIFAFLFADFFAEGFFVDCVDFYAAFAHFAEDDAAEIYLGDAFLLDVLDGGGFAAAGHAYYGYYFGFLMFHLFIFLCNFSFTFPL